MLVGCTKGKHRSKHHTEFTYANYFFHMSDLVSYLVVHVREERGERERERERRSVGRRRDREKIL